MAVENPLILTLDSATPFASVALTRGTIQHGTVLATLGLGGSVSHSRKLLAGVEYLMEKCEIGWSDLDGIGVSLGPGSFTGLRIGMATAKGLAVGAERPLLGVSTLDGLAARCMGMKLVCSLLDARKKEVYYGFYKIDDGGIYRGQGAISVGSPEECAARITEDVCMVGDGAVQYQEKFKALLDSRFSLAPAPLHEPSAIALGLLCGEKFEQGEFLDIASSTPHYIRRSDAELNLLRKKMMQGKVDRDSA